MINQIILIHKKSVIQNLSENEKSDLKEKNLHYYNVLINAHNTHAQSIDIVKQILDSIDFPYKIFLRGDANIPQLTKHDLAVTLGGDGTFINTSHLLKETPILGLNTSQGFSVGHYCSYAIIEQEKTLLELFIQIKKDNYKVKTLERLEILLNNKLIEFPIINDFLITEENPGGTSRYEITVNDVSEYQKSSGIWVSTSSGSTAAYKSAGGSFFEQFNDKGLKQFGYIVRELYNSKNKVNQKSLLNEKDSFEILSTMNQGRIYLDGAYRQFPFLLNDKICVKFTEYPLKVLI